MGQFVPSSILYTRDDKSTKTLFKQNTQGSTQLLHSYKGVAEGKFTVPIHQMQDFNRGNLQNMRKLSLICYFSTQSLTQQLRHVSQSAASLSILGTQNVVCRCCHQPRDGNNFVFITYDCWVPNIDNWDGSFHSQTFPASEVCCHAQSDINMEENHTTTRTGMFSHDGHSQAFQCGTVSFSINSAFMFHDIHQQHMQLVPQQSARRQCHLCHFKPPLPG